MHLLSGRWFGQLCNPAESDFRFGFGFVPDRHTRRIPCLVTGGLLEPGFGFGELFPAGFCLPGPSGEALSQRCDACLSHPKTDKCLVG